MGNDYMIEEQTEVTTKLKEPPLFNVIFLNDDKTSVDFVVAVMVEVFGKTVVEAAHLTQMIHEEGSAVVATLPYEIAEQKGTEVIRIAKQNAFPLKIKIEPDE